MTRYVLLAVMFGTCIATCHGDVVVLKSGKCITGEVISVSSRNDGCVFIRLENATRTISKTCSESITNVVKIIRDSPEEKARQKEESTYQDVIRLQLSSASYTVTKYDDVINALARFLNDYPNSIHTNSVEQVRKQWVDERKRVAGGEIKWNDAWYKGDAAAKIMKLVKASQLIADGDQFRNLKKYEAAIGKYMESLTVSPPTTRLVDIANQKFTAVLQQWKSQIDNFTAPGADYLAKLNTASDALRAQIASYQQALVQNQQRKQLIESAYLIPPPH